MRVYAQRKMTSPTHILDREVKIGLLAKEREEAHKGHASSRPLSENYELVGLAGETVFAEEFGTHLDERRLPAGDGGVDFAFTIRIDVKTARKAVHLLVEQGKQPADVMVLAEYDDRTGKATLVGWEWGRVMMRCGTRNFGYGVISHYKHRDTLKTMDSLHRLLSLARRIGQNDGC